MKDSEARKNIIELRVDLQAQVDQMCKGLKLLVDAHNGLFDHIAPKLGFEAADGYSYPFYAPGKLSPRVLAKRTVITIVDHKPCKQEKKK